MLPHDRRVGASGSKMSRYLSLLSLLIVTALMMWGCVGDGHFSWYSGRDVLLFSARHGRWHFLHLKASGNRQMQAVAFERRFDAVRVWFSDESRHFGSCDAPSPYLASLSLGFDYGYLRANTQSCTYVRAPQWPFFLIVLGFASLTIAGHLRRTRRGSEGRCRTCGYDLRASPDRCPECGTAADRNSLSG
jgi:hypothetical protein